METITYMLCKIVVRATSTGEGLWIIREQKAKTTHDPENLNPLPLRGRVKGDLLNRHWGIQ